MAVTAVLVAAAMVIGQINAVLGKRFPFTTDNGCRVLLIGPAKLKLMRRSKQPL